MEGKNKKKNNAKFSGHYVRQRTHNICAHELRSDQMGEEEEWIMPSLVATMSTSARTPLGPMFNCLLTINIDYVSL